MSENMKTRKYLLFSVCLFFLLFIPRHLEFHTLSRHKIHKSKSAFKWRWCAHAGHEAELMSRHSQTLVTKHHSNKNICRVHWCLSAGEWHNVGMKWVMITLKTQWCWRIFKLPFSHNLSDDIVLELQPFHSELRGFWGGNETFFYQHNDSQISQRTVRCYE